VARCVRAVDVAAIRADGVSAAVSAAAISAASGVVVVAVGGLCHTVTGGFVAAAIRVVGVDDGASAAVFAAATPAAVSAAAIEVVGVADGVSVAIIFEVIVAVRREMVGPIRRWSSPNKRGCSLVCLPHHAVDIHFTVPPLLVPDQFEHCFESFVAVLALHIVFPHG